MNNYKNGQSNFSFNSTETTILCLKEDKMESICIQFTSKIGLNINSIYFLFGGNKLNLELTFKQITILNEINILAFQFDNNEEIFCPKCGETIQIDKTCLENIICSNNNINDELFGLKGQIKYKWIYEKFYEKKI